MLDKLHQPSVLQRIEGTHDTLPTFVTSRRKSRSSEITMHWRAKPWMSWGGLIAMAPSSLR
jgi:hypothetical protein